MKQLVSSVKVNKKIETGQPSKELRKPAAAAAAAKKNEKIGNNQHATPARKGMKVRAYVHKYGTYRSSRPDISPERIAPDGITYVPKGYFWSCRIDACAAALSRVNLGDMNKSTHVWGNEFKE